MKKKSLQIALNLLARRDHSQRELLQKLCVRGYTQVEIEQTIANLQHAGFLNEQQFVKNYIQRRQANGYGPLRISVELQARGISHEMIAEHLDITDNAWFVAAQKVWQKHCKHQVVASLQDRKKILAKQIRFLQYRGFTSMQIEHIANLEEKSLTHSIDL